MCLAPKIERASFMTTNTLTQTPRIIIRDLGTESAAHPVSFLTEGRKLVATMVLGALLIASLMSALVGVITSTTVLVILAGVVGIPTGYALAVGLAMGLNARV